MRRSLSPLAAEALGAMALVGDDFAGESDPRVEAEMRDGGEHGVCRVGAGVQSADDAALICQIASKSDPHFAPNRDPCIGREWSVGRVAFLMDGAVGKWPAGATVKSLA